MLLLILYLFGVGIFASKYIMYLSDKVPVYRCIALAAVHPVVILVFFLNLIMRFFGVTLYLELGIVRDVSDEDDENIQ